MKLLTHNFLACHIKSVKNGYPLKIEATKVCISLFSVLLLPISFPSVLIDACTEYKTC